MDACTRRKEARERSTEGAKVLEPGTALKMDQHERGALSTTHLQHTCMWQGCTCLSSEGRHMMTFRRACIVGCMRDTVHVKPNTIKNVCMTSQTSAYSTPSLLACVHVYRRYLPQRRRLSTPARACGGPVARSHGSCWLHARSWLRR